MAEKYSVTLTDFILNDGKNMPEEFEVYVVIMEDGSLSAGCWDEGSYYTEQGLPGCFAQSRGGSIKLSEVKAWIPIEKFHI